MVVTSPKRKKDLAISVKKEDLFKPVKSKKKKLKKENKADDDLLANKTAADDDKLHEGPSF